MEGQQMLLSITIFMTRFAAIEKMRIGNETEIDDRRKYMSCTEMEAEHFFALILRRFYFKA